MARGTSEDDWQSTSGIARKVRLLVMTLLRAGLLLLPAVGAAVEKLAFGIKDASAADELLSLVRAVQQTLYEQGCPEHVLSDAEISALSYEIVEKRLSSKLENAFAAVSDELLPMLNAVFTEAAAQTGALKEFQEEARLAHDALLRQQQELLEKMTLQAERHDQLLEMILDRAGTLHENPQAPPGELLAVLEDPEVERALEYAQSAIRAAHFHGERAEAVVAADFSELYSFAHGGIGGDDLYPPTIALFRHSRVPVIALPGTLNEMLTFLRLEMAGLLHRTADLATGRAAEHMPLPVLGGFRPLFNTLLGNTLQPWQGPPLRHELWAVRDRAVSLLAKIKGGYKLPSIYQDAQNIAFLVQIATSNRRDCAGVVFVSRDRALQRVWHSLVDHPTSQLPQIASPVEWAFEAFLRSDDISAFLRREALRMSHFETCSAESRSRITRALRSTSADEIIGIQEQLGLLVATLSACRSSLRGFSSWLAMLAKRESATASRFVWDYDVMEAYAIAMRALTGLERYVEELVRAFGPFREV